MERRKRLRNGVKFLELTVTRYILVFDTAGHQKRRLQHHLKA